MGLKSIDSTELESEWKAAANTYLGLTVSGYPNMFHMVSSSRLFCDLSIYTCAFPISADLRHLALKLVQDGWDRPCADATLPPSNSPLHRLATTLLVLCDLETDCEYRSMDLMDQLCCPTAPQPLRCKAVGSQTLSSR